MDKDLDKILRRAKKGDPETPRTEGPVKAFPKNKPYDHLVFTQLVRLTGFHPILFLFIFPTALCVGFLFDGFVRETIYSLVIYGGLILFYLLINQVRYHFVFKGWKEKLPFD